MNKKGDLKEEKKERKTVNEVHDNWHLRKSDLVLFIYEHHGILLIQMRSKRENGIERDSYVDSLVPLVITDLLLFFHSILFWLSLFARIIFFSLCFR